MNPLSPLQKKNLEGKQEMSGMAWIKKVKTKTNQN